MQTTMLTFMAEGTPLRGKNRNKNKWVRLIVYTTYCTQISLNTNLSIKCLSSQLWPKKVKKYPHVSFASVIYVTDLISKSEYCREIASFPQMNRFTYNGFKWKKKKWNHVFNVTPHIWMSHEKIYINSISSV